MTGALWLIDASTRELMLFAGVGLLLGGVDDLIVDLLFLLRRVAQRRGGRRALADLPVPGTPARLAILVPAWDESAVIGAMLDTALNRLTPTGYRIFVGVYPNDQATIDAVVAIAQRDARVQLVIGPRPGPTTKADCLNALWRALARDDRAAGVRTHAVVLHDAEDVVHTDECSWSWNWEVVRPGFGEMKWDGAGRNWRKTVLA